MKTYKKEITLNKNRRGCYILDTIKGCSVCLETYPKGCYDDCYAKNIANRYSFDFSKSIKRQFIEDNKQLYLFGFKDISHIEKIKKEIRKCNLPFIRIGEMGDPSEDWDHTINICKEINDCGKVIVIITKHWKALSDKTLNEIKKLNICINTSISALDTEQQFSYRLTQFYRLKPYCKSVLRVVSCDFNKENPEGFSRSILQEELFKHTPNIDTAFRPSKDNRLVIGNIINIEKTKFVEGNVLVGKCKDCPDQCGINEHF
jgi:hypothetical protein